MSDGGFVLSGPDQTRLFQMLRVASALAMEINTGLKVSSRGSVMKYAADMCGSPKRTKKGVMKDYSAWLATQIEGYEPNPSVKRALGL